ncbi:MAG: hypothetical protein AAFY58_02675, partial [Planctomycetota bacterium]
MKTTASIAALALIAGAANGQLELTTNGDFEAGDTSGWESFPTGDSSFDVTANAADVFAGEFSGVLGNVATGSAAVIKQANIGIGQVMPGMDVEISFWAKATNEVGGVNFAEFFSELDGG